MPTHPSAAHTLCSRPDHPSPPPHTLLTCSMTMYKPWCRITPRSRTRFLCCSFLGVCGGGAGWEVSTHPGPQPQGPLPPGHSRHHCCLIQEGLGCHITLDILHSHLLPQVLTLQDSCGRGQSSGPTSKTDIQTDLLTFLPRIPQSESGGVIRVKPRLEFPQ